MDVFFKGRVYEGVEEMPLYAKERGIIKAYLNCNTGLYPSIPFIGSHTFDDGDVITGKFIKKYDADKKLCAIYGTNPEIIRKQKLASYEWTEKNVYDFVNWYIKMRELPDQYKLNNRRIIESFVNGDTPEIWHFKTV